MRRRLDRLLMMVWAVSGVAPAPVTAPVVVVMTGCPSPSSNLAWEVLVRWLDSVSSGGNGG
jgi:hypothetical protein